MQGLKKGGSLLFLSFFVAILQAFDSPPFRDALLNQDNLFRTIAPDRRQVTGVIKPQIPVASRVQCAAACLRDPRCVAVNFRSQRLQCDILSGVSQQKYLQFEEGTDFIISSRLVKSCKDDPCLNGGTCSDKAPGPPDYLQAYKCTCSCGYCGLNCETLNYWSQPHAGIFGHNIPHSESVKNINECLALCLRTPTCRSADFVHNDHSCNLNNATHENAPLKRIEGITYIMPICKCSTGNIKTADTEELQEKDDGDNAFLALNTESSQDNYVENELESTTLSEMN